MPPGTTDTTLAVPAETVTFPAILRPMVAVAEIGQLASVLEVVRESDGRALKQQMGKDWRR